MSVSATPFKGVVPAAGTAIAKATATQNPANTWVQLIASTSSPIYVLSMHGSAGSDGTTLYLGTGAGGAETTVATAYKFVPTGNVEGMDAIFTVPVRIPAGTRVAIKASIGNASYVAGILYVAEGPVV